MNNKAYEDQLDYVDLRVGYIRENAHSPAPYEQVKFPLRDLIIREILDIVVNLEERIIATDKDGNVKLNKNGKPKVDWLKVIGSLGFIIGRIVGVIIETKKVK